MVEQTRIAVVTGGNRGIGFEICRQLADKGIHVILTARDEEKGKHAADELAAAGLPVAFRVLDVLDPDGIAALAEHVQSEHGGLDILVNNAGVAMSGFDLEVVQTTIDTNVFAPLAICDTLLPLMRAGGRVVNVSSSMGERSCLSEELVTRFQGEMSRDEFIDLMSSFVSDVEAGRHEESGWPSSAYRVSKLALNKLTEILAHELEAQGNPRRILINAACPGWVRTEMGGPHAPRTAEEGADTPVWLALLGDDAPQGEFFRDRGPVTW